MKINTNNIFQLTFDVSLFKILCDYWTGDFFYLTRTACCKHGNIRKNENFLCPPRFYRVGYERITCLSTTLLLWIRRSYYFINYINEKYLYPICIAIVENCFSFGVFILSFVFVRRTSHQLHDYRMNDLDTYVCTNILLL